MWCAASRPARVACPSVQVISDLSQPPWPGERSVITIGPDLDARDAAQTILDHKIGALPVIDDGRLIGIVTETDLLRAFVRVGAESRTLRGR